MTASVGTATCDPSAEYSHDIAVQLADRALYAAKETGRDGWACHDPAASVQFSSAQPDGLLEPRAEVAARAEPESLGSLVREIAARLCDPVLPSRAL